MAMTLARASTLGLVWTVAGSLATALATGVAFSLALVATDEVPLGTDARIAEGVGAVVIIPLFTMILTFPTSVLTYAIIVVAGHYGPRRVASRGLLLAVTVGICVGLIGTLGPYIPLAGLYDAFELASYRSILAPTWFLATLACPLFFSRFREYAHEWLLG